MSCYLGGGGRGGVGIGSGGYLLRSEIHPRLSSSTPPLPTHLVLWERVSLIQLRICSWIDSPASVLEGPPPLPPPYHLTPGFGLLFVGAGHPSLNFPFLSSKRFKNKTYQVIRSQTSILSSKSKYLNYCLIPHLFQALSGFVTILT